MIKGYSSTEDKIIQWKALRQLGESMRNRRSVLVGGCFDLIHFGHLTFLEKAKKTGDFLIIALESDTFIRKRKKRQPIHNQKQRAKILANITLVDKVILLPYLKSDEKYYQLVETIKPKVIAVSGHDGLLENKKRQAKKVGAQLKVVTPLLKGFSTSRIIK
jgi:FAD synthetase